MIREQPIVRNVVIDKFYEHRFAFEAFLVDELSKYKAGLVQEYNFPYECLSLLLCTYSPGYRVLEIADTDFLIKLLYNLSEYTRNCVNVFNAWGDMLIHERLKSTSRDCLLTKRIKVWLAACTVTPQVRDKLMALCFAECEKMRECTDSRDKRIKSKCLQSGQSVQSYKTISTLDIKDTYIINNDSVKELEQLVTFSEHFVNNIGNSKRFKEAYKNKKQTIYLANTDYFPKIREKMNELKFSTKVQDEHIQTLLSLSYMICKGINKNKLAIVFLYDDIENTEVYFVNTSSIAEYVYSAQAKEYYCISRKKENNVIIEYTLRDNQGYVINYEAKALKRAIASGEIRCINLKLCNNGALRKTD